MIGVLEEDQGGAFAAPQEEWQKADGGKRITVDDRRERQEFLTFPRNESQLLLQLPRQSRLGTLSRFDLAAGKLPQAREQTSGGTLDRQKKSFVVDKHGADDGRVATFPSQA